ncbi:MAG: hypothetical protein IJS28_02240 [Synergistaceae bacterium]|nr:hypothetical protein [Synergistaceae bacterium]
MKFKGDKSGSANYGTPFWRDSTPRAWLQGTFYTSAFTAEEKGKIAQLVLDDVKQDTYNFTDTVFLLSKTEFESYHPSSLGKNWWLRSLAKSGNTFNVYYIADATNNTAYMGIDTSASNLYYIRPALWLKYGD